MNWVIHCFVIPHWNRDVYSASCSNKGSILSLFLQLIDTLRNQSMDFCFSPCQKCLEPFGCPVRSVLIQSPFPSSGSNVNVMHLHIRLPYLGGGLLVLWFLLLLHWFCGLGSCSWQ